jgi:predicted metal-dependent hydrolase
MVPVDPMIDYARPMMMAEKALKDAHNALLDRDTDVALGELMQAIVEVKLAINCIKLMEEKNAR